MVGAHNRVVGLRANIVEAWAQVDALLERRGQVLNTLAQALWDLWPNGRGAVDALRSAQQQLQVAAQAVRSRPTRARRGGQPGHRRGRTQRHRGARAEPD